MRHRLLKAALYLLLAVIVAYVADTALWAAHGRPGSIVNVITLTSASQKGNKVEYFPADSSPAPCLVRAFPAPTPDGFLPPCWWLRRHSDRSVQL